MSSARKSVKGVENKGGLTGRRKRQETLLCIRKAKKEDVYTTRRNLKANRPKGTIDAEHNAANSTGLDGTSKKELLENIAARSQSLLIGTVSACNDPLPM